MKRYALSGSLCVGRNAALISRPNHKKFEAAFTKGKHGKKHFPRLRVLVHGPLRSFASWSYAIQMSCRLEISDCNVQSRTFMATWQILRNLVRHGDPSDRLPAGIYGE